MESVYIFIIIYFFIASFMSKFAGNGLCNNIPFIVLSLFNFSIRFLVVLVLCFLLVYILHILFLLHHRLCFCFLHIPLMQDYSLPVLLLILSYSRFLILLLLFLDFLLFFCYCFSIYYYCHFYCILLLNINYFYCKINCII